MEQDKIEKNEGFLVGELIDIVEIEDFDAILHT